MTHVSLSPVFRSDLTLPKNIIEYFILAAGQFAAGLKILTPFSRNKDRRLHRKHACSDHFQGTDYCNPKLEKGKYIHTGIIDSQVLKS